MTGQLPGSWRLQDKTFGVVSELQGVVTAISVGAGDAVRSGQTLLWVESMKLEHPVHAPLDGVVVAVDVGPGDEVRRDETLIRLRPGSSGPVAADAPAPAGSLDAPAERADLREVRERQRLLTDEARPQAVAKRLSLIHI